MNKFNLTILLAVTLLIVGCSKDSNNEFPFDPTEEAKNISFLEDFKLLESLYGKTESDIRGILDSKHWSEVWYEEDSREDFICMSYQSPGGIKKIVFNFHKGEGEFCYGLSIVYVDSLSMFDYGTSFIPLCEYLGNAFVLKQRGHMESDYIYEYRWCSYNEQTAHNYYEMMNLLNLPPSQEKWGITWVAKGQSYHEISIESDCGKKIHLD